MPTGYLGDRYGPRKTLIRIVLWWSFFFCLTTLVGYQIGSVALVGVTGLAVLVVFRFLFGMGEAGAYPNIGPRRCTTGSRCRSAAPPRARCGCRPGSWAG